MIISSTLLWMRQMMLIKMAFFHNFSWNASAKKNCKQKGSLLWTDKFGKIKAATFLPRDQQ